MRAAFIQTHPAFLEPERNVRDAVDRATGLEADLVVLPELFTSGYFFGSTDEVRHVAEPAHASHAVEALAALASRTGATYVAGLPERDGEVIYNSAVVVDRTGLRCVYRKVHLFYEEKLHFQPGDLGFRVTDVQTRAGAPYRLGVMVCFDWYFPEAARSLALQGADVIAHPANLVRKDCPRAMPIRALENHVYTITANRVGSEQQGGRTLHFIGQSLICDPEGDILASAPKDKPHAAVASLDLALPRERAITEHNDLFADRRPDVYQLK